MFWSWEVRRTVADEIAGVAESGVGGDAFPEEERSGGVAVILVDAGAAALVSLEGLLYPPQLAAHQVFNPRDGSGEA